MAEVTITASNGSTGVIIKNGSGNLSGTDFWLGERNDQANSEQRILTKVNLATAGITAGSTIDSVKLRAYIIGDFSDNARTARVRYLKRDWVENEVTWSIYSTGNNWQTAGGGGADDRDSTDLATASYTASESTSAYKEFIFNATGISTVQSWLDGGLSNNGVQLFMDTELDDAYRHNRDDAGSNDFEWVIEYTPGVVSVSDTQGFFLV